MREVMKFVCPCCGWITDGVHEGEEICFVCKIPMVETKYTSDEYFYRDIKKGSDLPPLKPAIFEEYVKNNPLYDPKKEAEKEAILEEKRIRRESRSYNSGNNNVPKCPTCGSTNLSKITLAHKAGKIALFGVFGMGDNGKTWKCNNCGSKW